MIPTTDTERFDNYRSLRDGNREEAPMTRKTFGYAAKSAPEGENSSMTASLAWEIQGGITQLASEIACCAITSGLLANKEDVAGFITEMRAVLISDISSDPKPYEPVSKEPMPAATVRKSITPDHLISFLDGKPYRTLKRHLAANGRTAESYRAEFGLPVDYPMVAANYRAARQAIAKRTGLGRADRFAA